MSHALRVPCTQHVPFPECPRLMPHNHLHTTRCAVAEAGSTGATSAQTPMLSVIHQTHQGEDSGAMESESESEEGGEDGSNGGDGGGSSDDGSEEEGGQRRDNWSEMGENTEEELSR